MCDRIHLSSSPYILDDEILEVTDKGIITKRFGLIPASQIEWYEKSPSQDC